MNRYISKKIADRHVTRNNPFLFRLGIYVFRLYCYYNWDTDKIYACMYIYVCWGLWGYVRHTIKNVGNLTVNNSKSLIKVKIKIQISPTSFKTLHPMSVWSKTDNIFRLLLIMTKIMINIHYRCCRLSFINVCIHLLSYRAKLCTFWFPIQLLFYILNTLDLTLNCIWW